MITVFYFFAQGKVVVHGVAATVLVWVGSQILAGGCDQKFTCYSSDGRPVQNIEFNSKNQEHHELTTAVASNCGQMVACGSFDKWVAILKRTFRILCDSLEILWRFIFNQVISVVEGYTYWRSIHVRGCGKRALLRR